MITAASIISRSASGSASLPNCDSTCHRRASQPSTWSVTPAAAKTIPAGQLASAVGGDASATTKTGISSSRRTSARSAAERAEPATDAGARIPDKRYGRVGRGGQTTLRRGRTR